MKRKIALTIYIVRFLVIITVCGVMTFFGTHKAIGNEEEADMSGINYLNATEKFDNWASLNFGFRNRLIGLNNRISMNVFGQSGEKSVIVGEDGWLFYESALHDYTGEDVLSDEEIAELAKLITEASEAVTRQGAAAVWVIAPNKMEIYGEKMPYYLIENTADGNYEKLMKALSGTDVNYVDLKKTLTDSRNSFSEPIYHKLDSHWNNIGAGIAYEAVMDSIGLSHTEYSDAGYTMRNNFSGDLYAMLFADGREKDMQAYYDIMPEFLYTSNYRGDDDLLITTSCDTGEGKLLMFRDSFGNALHSFFAADFSEAEFRRSIPYDISDIKGADVVVFEIVERNIPNLIKYPPILP